MPFSPPPNDTEFVTVDLETTGLNPLSDSIIEICVLKVTMGVPRQSGEYSTIKLGRPLPPFIVELTGITDKELDESRTFEEVMPSFFDLIGDKTVFAYNAEFDMGFLKMAAMRLGRTFNNKSFCVMNQARGAFPWLPGGHSLQNVTEVMGLFVDGPSHRASSDAQLALMLCSAIWQGKQPFGAEKITLKYECSVAELEDLAQITSA